MNIEHLICPHTGSRLRREDDNLVNEDSTVTYPIRDGVPSLLPLDIRKNAEKDPYSLVNLEHYDEIDYEIYRKCWSQYLDEDNANWVKWLVEDACDYKLTNKKIRVLDLGCGDGYFITNLMLASVVDDAYALDISYAGPRRVLEQAKANAWGITAVQGSAYRLPFEDNYFDVVVGNGVLHHLGDLKKVAVELNRVIAPGGMGVFIEPTSKWGSIENLFSLRGLARRLVGGIPGIKNLAWKIARKLPEPESEEEEHEPPLATKEEYIESFKQAGFECEAKQFHVLAGYLRAAVISRLMKKRYMWFLESFLMGMLRLARRLDEKYFSESEKGFYYSYRIKRLPYRLVK